MTIINSTACRRTRQSRPSGQAHIKAHKALHIIKEYSPTRLATRPNLYKRCLDGVATFEALRPRVTPHTESQTYSTLAGQQFARMFATASLDNVLTVLIYETTNHKWECHMVTDVPGLIFGSPGSRPYATREEAEQAVIVALGGLGIEHKPAEGYEPIRDPDTKRQIRVNGDIYIVCEWPEEMVNRSIRLGMQMHSLTEDALLARFADMLLREDYPPNAVHEAKTVALSLLANCGWTHVTQEVVDDFCAANGIDMGEAP
jgi:hypothetical protein